MSIDQNFLLCVPLTSIDWCLFTMYTSVRLIPAFGSGHNHKCGVWDQYECKFWICYCLLMVNCFVQHAFMTKLWDWCSFFNVILKQTRVKQIWFVCGHIQVNMHSYHSESAIVWRTLRYH